MPCGPICHRLAPVAADPGKFPGEGASNPKKTHWRRLKVTKTNRIWYSWGKGCPPFSLPPSLVSVAQFSFFPQLYQIQLVLVTLRLAARDGPPDINSPNVHVKTRKTWKNIGFTCFSSGFHHQVPFLSPTVSDTTGSPPPPGDGPGGIRASDLKAPSLNCLVVHPPGPPKIQNPESKIQNSPIQNPKSKLFRPDFGDFGFWSLDFGIWILDRYVAFLYMRPPPPQISGILDFGFWISDFGFWILDFGFWILDFGFRILDFGALCSNSSCANFGFWILDFGFWILVWGRFRGHFLDAT